MKQHIKHTLEQSHDAAYRQQENSTARLDVLMQRIDEVENVQTTSEKRGVEQEQTSLFSALQQWFFGAGNPQLRYAGWMLGAVLLAQSGYIAYQQQQLGVVSYQAASGAPAPVTTPADTTQYLVIFTPDTPMSEISELLQKHDGQLLSGPHDGGAYTLGFTAPLSEEQQNQFEAHAAVALFSQQE